MHFSRNKKFRIPEALIRYLCGWVQPGDRGRAVSLIHLMRLDALPEIANDGEFTEVDNEALATELELQGSLAPFVSSVVVADRPYEGSLVEQLRNNLLEKYRDTVFSNAHVADPPPYPGTLRGGHYRTNARRDA